MAFLVSVNDQRLPHLARADQPFLLGDGPQQPPDGPQQPPPDPRERTEKPPRICSTSDDPHQGQLTCNPRFLSVMLASMSKGLLQDLHS
jgi:hypothetical protein